MENSLNSLILTHENCEENITTLNILSINAEGGNQYTYYVCNIFYDL